jgi:Peptidase A4 family
MSLRKQPHGRVYLAVRGLGLWRVAALAVAVVVLAAVVGLASGPARGPAGTRRASARATLADCSLVPETVTCSSWSGYVSLSQDVTQVSAQFQVPAISCTADESGPGGGAWVGIQGPDGDGSTGLVQNGIGWSCENGQPSYYAWTDTSPTNQGAMPLPHAVNAGDFVTATVYAVDGFGDYQMDVQDWTQGWNQVVSQSGGPLSSVYSAVAVEDDNGGALFNPMQVTNAAMNGDPLGQASPQLWVQDPAIYQVPGGPLPPPLVPGPLDSSGQDFSFAWGNQAALGGNQAPLGPGSPSTPGSPVS